MTPLGGSDYVRAGRMMMTIYIYIRWSTAAAVKNVVSTYVIFALGRRGGGWRNTVIGAVVANKGARAAIQLYRGWSAARMRCCSTSGWYDPRGGPSGEVQARPFRRGNTARGPSYNTPSPPVYIIYMYIICMCLSAAFLSYCKIRSRIAVPRVCHRCNSERRRPHYQYI